MRLLRPLVCADGRQVHTFGLDLAHLPLTDNPCVAMAFTCVHTAYLMRCIMLLNGVPQDTAWQVLLLNTQCALYCFSGWEGLMP